VPLVLAAPIKCLQSRYGNRYADQDGGLDEAS